MTLPLLLTLLLLGQDDLSLRPDPPIECSNCAEWNARKESFRVFGNTYDVGVAGLGAVLVTSDAGHVLLDAGLPQSAPRIDESIRALGFRTEDVRLILNSHAHSDHAGGIAAIQRASGATVVASAAGARALEQGEPLPEDPQYAFGPEVNRFPAVADVRVVADGEVLRLGDLAITAHLTPGHTPGSTTWTWRSCDDTDCKDVVYVDSLNPVSAPGFRFTDDAARIEAYRRSIVAVAALPCDILLAVHPGYAPDDTCRKYADDALERLERRIEEENDEEKMAAPGSPDR